ncbi:hypothetical protein BgiMline_010567 [Biomphalaria glabrata]|nr:zinc finger protein Helios-like [Biomphalaria glabrata]
MDTLEVADVVVKKEPVETVSNENDEAGAQLQVSTETTNSLPQGRLRYVSRRGRPPGGGYSMKTHSHYISFNSSAGDLSRHPTLSGSMSAQDLLKSNLGADSIDLRRFGIHGFENDKSSFRCDGCDVVFSSRDTYAMHMLLRAKNESCVALPTSAISPNPENPTPREKFERELRQQAMLMALRNQAAVMSKAAAAMMPSSGMLPESIQPLTSPGISTKDEIDLSNTAMAERALNFGSLFCIDAFGVYVDPKQYRRFLNEYGLQSSSSSNSLVSMLEQMSCSVCGEVFSNKDALAMHVMYHTRDEDSENKSGVLWPDVSINMSSKNQILSSSSNSSSSTSPGPCPALSSKSGTGEDKKVKHTQSQDRELTAERVAELKRMAIESSLRSPPKKTSGRTLSRPKSVSHDVTVGATAQTRPLSADDAMMLSNGCSKNKAGSKTQQQKDFYDTGFYRKRGADGDSNESKEDAAIDKMNNPKRLREETSHPLTSTKEIHCNETSLQDAHLSGETKVDSDKTRSIPYLEAIMAQEAVLVPVEALESDEENSKTKDDAGEEMSALDFSRTGRERAAGLERSSWYSAPIKQNTDLDTRHRDGNETKEQTDRSSINRNLYYANTSDSTENNRLNHSHFTGMNGTCFTSKSNRMSFEYQQNERPPKGSQTESQGRAGEARYCPHCEILFLDVTLFHLHMGLHNVNNPWQCNTCGLVCAGRLDFNTHVLHY